MASSIWLLIEWRRYSLENISCNRIVFEELQRLYVVEISTAAELDHFIDETNKDSKALKVQVDCFMKPVFFMILHILAERKSEQALHLYAVYKIVSYVFSAGHRHYVWYMMYNLNNTKKVPSLIKKTYFCGDQIYQLQKGSLEV